MKTRHTFNVITLFFLLAASAMHAQKSIVLLPDNYSQDKKYPLVFFMPGTGGYGREYAVYLMARKQDWSAVAQRKLKQIRSADPNNTSVRVNVSYGDFTDDDLNGMYRRYTKERGGQQFIMAYLPGGIPASDYATGQKFAQLIERVDGETAREAEALKKKYSVDTSRVYFSGFSVGGDMSFAVPARSPGRYAGALVIASKCTYRCKGCFETMAAKNFQYGFLIGDKDPRQKMMSDAVQLLKSKGVHTSFGTYSGAHSIPEFNTYLTALQSVIQ